MIEVGKTYTHEDSDIAMTIKKITYESPVHFRIMAVAFVKKTGQEFRGLQEYNLEKAIIQSKKWKEYSK